MEFIFATALAIFCALGGYLFIMLNGQKLLNENEDKLSVNPPTQIFDRNANLIGELSLEKSDPVEYEDIPKQLIEAFVATEDKRFLNTRVWIYGRSAEQPSRISLHAAWWKAAVRSPSSLRRISF